MKIDGKKLADDILTELHDRLVHQSRKPTLAIIQIGNNPNSTNYIREKKSAADSIGIEVVHDSFTIKAPTKTIIARVGEHNSNHRIDGIIVQLPLPDRFDEERIIEKIAVRKDVDGFQTESPYTPPVGCAVLTAISAIYNAPDSTGRLNHTLRKKKIVIIGRGLTGGRPVMRTFDRQEIPYTVIHRSTERPDRLMQSADIIISCVGQPGIVTPEKIKKDVILISVGLSRLPDGRLVGDYFRTDINNIAAYYTPTPGGIGPLTVACLLRNVVKSASKSLINKYKLRQMKH